MTCLKCGEAEMRIDRRRTSNNYWLCPVCGLIIEKASESQMSKPVDPDLVTFFEKVGFALKGFAWFIWHDILGRGKGGGTIG